jgi:hydroxyacylglutathione hydrolase
MKIQQIYTKCLAQGAYYISSEGEVAIIDPLREVGDYLDMAKQEGANIKYVFETHFHADFVSGHLDLAQKTGAQIVYGQTAEPNFPAHIAKDGERFAVGKLQIEAIHTPGHTMESTCYLLYDEQQKPIAIFTGDTLFLGDVGRPDLAQKAAHLSQEELAGMLYDSLYSKILPLPDDIVVYPAHGAGSACGKNMIDATQDTLGNQKKTNYALNQASKSAFVLAVTEGLTAPPAYFPLNVAMNKQGSQSVDAVLAQSAKALSAQAFENLLQSQKATVLDVRNADIFCKGFIPESINIGLGGEFAPWAGAILQDVQTPLLLVAEENQVDEAIIRLSRVGFDHVLGYLAGGVATWQKAGKPLSSIKRISAEDFAGQKTDTAILDVRKQGEYEKQHLQHAKHLPLADIHAWSKNLDKTKPYTLHCQGGYRSMIATSFLQKQGFQNLQEIAGGFASLAKTNLPRIEANSCNL